MRVLGMLMIAVGLMFSCQKADFSDLDKDTYNVQSRLDAGETPIQILNSGVPMEHLMGKEYQNGYIFYLDAQTGEGLVCSKTDIFNEVSENYYNLLSTDPFTLPQTIQLQDGMGAGEYNTEVLNNYLNENANVLSRVMTFDADTNWYLPSQQELMAIHNNLHRLSLVDFSLDFYWTSNIDDNGVICIDFTRNDIPNPVYVQPNGVAKARAVKKF